MQRQHEEELVAARAECATRITWESGVADQGKEKVLGEEDEGQPRTHREHTTEHSSASDRTWKLEETGTDKGKERIERVESTLLSRQLVVKEEDVCG